MSTPQILLLGAVAGFTIFLGLPVGRIRLGPQARAGMSALATGVHIFGEGLAIGQSAAGGEVALAVTLIVGFSLHNATEGFGIVGPMSGEGTRASWGFLGLLGVIGGTPTFFGTLLGQAWTSDAVTILFMTVAAGSILFVVQELFAVNRK